jgi:hypothetical protein
MVFRKRTAYQVFCIYLATAFFSIGSAWVDQKTTGQEEKKIDFSGSIAMEAGQFVKYKYRSIDFLHKWLQQNMVCIGLHSAVDPRLELFLNVGGALSYNTISPKVIGDPDNYANSPIIGFFIDQAEIRLHCSPNPADSLLNISIGLFNEKYNPDVRNLGEYLFRSGAYPGYIDESGFDQPHSQLGGIRISSDLFGTWHNELLLTSELYLAPYNDFSLAYLAGASFFNKAFSIGGGIQFFRCLQADPTLTSPKTVKGGDIAPNYYLDSTGVDTNSNPVYDTNFYTFAGTKVMARVSFDPKKLFQTSLFGEEDLKIYMEMAILGLKNYPNSPLNSPYLPASAVINKSGFDTLLHKMPVMVGFNIPAFKLLDVLSCEVEYYGKKYVNAVPIPSGNRTGVYYPVSSPPAQAAGGSVYDSLYEKGGAVNWKWSVYARKTMFRRFSITAQAARDHIRNTVRGLSMLEVDREEALVKKSQWYWMLKFSASF